MGQGRDAGGALVFGVRRSCRGRHYGPSLLVARRLCSSGVRSSMSACFARFRRQMVMMAGLLSSLAGSVVVVDTSTEPLGAFAGCADTLMSLWQGE